MNDSTSVSVNRAKTYQLVLFPLNNGATNVYYVLVLSYIATFGSKVLALSMLFASVMVTGMRLFDAITDPIIGALMDRTNGKFGKFRPFMVIGNLIMAASILVLYCLTPLIPASAMGLRYAAFVGLYAVWVIGYTFQTSCTRSGQTVLTNDPKQRPLFTIFNSVGSLLGMGAMQFFAPILAKNYEGGYASAGFFRTLAPVGIVISILLTLLAVIGIWEKDQPKYFGIGGEKTEKIKVREYIQIIKNNNPMQRLMVAGAGCKLALSIATNTTVLCMLYGCMMGNYDGLYLPMMVLGYVFSVPFFLLTVRTSQKQGQKASLMKYVSVAFLCYIGVLVLLLLWGKSDAFTLSIMGENGLIAKVELDGFNPNGVMSAIQMRGKLRGLKDTTGQPIFKSDMQGATRYGLDGMDMYFPMNGAFDPSQAQMIVGDWSQLVYAIRQDMTFKIFTEGVIQDPTTKTITYNLMQNDMVALRAVMRLGWEIANPVNAYNVDIANPFPFSVYGKAGTVSTVTVSPATATVAKGASKAFSASVAGEGIVSGDVEWSQSGAKSSITEGGVLKVASNETSTSITVTAKSKQDSTKTGTATVTVGS